jgi:predicted transcriptional regulator
MSKTRPEKANLDAELVERFIAGYNRIDKYLRAVLNSRGQDSFTHLVGLYFSNRLRRWREPLLAYAQIRNFLSHRTTRPGEYLVVPTLEVVENIQAIATELERPKRAIPTFKRKVITVNQDDSLAAVLRLIDQHDFSQLPVYHDDRFVGLLTENGITRWLAHHVRTEISLVELEEARVRLVVREEETTKNVQFMRSDATVDDVVEAFRGNPVLEAVLLTTNGRRHESLLGIATQWDVLAHLS